MVLGEEALMTIASLFKYTLLAFLLGVPLLVTTGRQHLMGGVSGHEEQTCDGGRDNCIERADPRIKSGGGD
jgi:hypothetical protein